ncbi:MAG: CaiB/BaiF CoA-transferase family protein [Alphaproteobacteria bacterium]
MAPLTGIRVIDVSAVAAAPYVGQILGDFGADVIKVEPPHGDDGRRMGAPGPRGAAVFEACNRNKRAMALDLADRRGREVLLRLLEGADILLENFKPGTLEKWGLSYAGVLRQRFPRLIHCSVTGFGQTGPYSRFPGYDAMGQAFGGIMSFNGNPEDEAGRVAVSVADLTSTGMAAMGVLLALQERHRSGLGQSVDIGLMDSALSLLIPYGLNWMLGGDGAAPKRLGNRIPHGAPHDVFRTRTGNVFLCVITDAQFIGLCEGLGRPDLARDPRFMPRDERIKNADALKAILDTLLADEEAEPLSERMLAKGVPVGAVLTVPQAFRHKQAVAREMRVEAPGYSGIGTPIKLDRTPMQIARIPPRFAQHNREVLREAGFSEAEIDKLIAEGVVPETPRPLRA